MTEPGTDDPESPDEAESQLDAALGAFKTHGDDADTRSVSETGRSGMTWSPVTDTETRKEPDPEPEPSPRSSFQFDLGSALARLGGATAPPRTDDAPSDVDGDDLRSPEPSVDPEQAPEPLPVRARRSEAEPTSTPRPDDDEPLPVRARRSEAEPTSTPRPDDDEPLPVRAPSARSVPADDPEPLPTRKPIDPRVASPDIAAAGQTDTTPEVVDRLPTRTPRSEPAAAASTTADERAVEPTEARARAAGRSVFEDAQPAPTLPSSGAPTLPTQPSGAAPSASVPAADGPTLPSLPSTTPAAPPPAVAPIESAPSTPDLNALRSAQLRASRNDRQGKLFGRVLLAFLVVGGLVAAALLFGRSYLFPTEWDPEATPLVDEIQSTRGVEFDHAIPLVEQPGSDYAPLVTGHVFGADWTARLPEWRALGLALGDGAVADVQTRVATLYPVFHDPESDTLVASADRSVDARRPALQLALESALDRQLGGDEGVEPGPSLELTGLESMDQVARRAYDAAALGLVTSAPDAATDLTGVPVPVAYHLRAIDRLGAPLVDDIADPHPGDPLPPAATRLDDAPELASGGLFQPGDQQILAPTALGADDWALIWGTRLPSTTVDDMTTSLAADSYSLVDRSGATCFVAVFQTTTDAASSTLLAHLGSWASGAPVAAQAAATQIGPSSVQLEACDPGVDAVMTPSVGATDLVIGRQLARLAG